jgi:Family of unknown function (DUF6804)
LRDGRELFRRLRRGDLFESAFWSYAAEAGVWRVMRRLTWAGILSKTWAVVFIVIAIAFNPFIQLRLSRLTWPYLDFGAAITLGVHPFFGRQKLA